ncbi:MAG: hypothetical protein IKO47_08715 [Ruminococcus sp.]|nr:hypothetical protein [Ruminococcus sp.]
MAKRICLMTSYPTECKDDCFNCDCGGKEATKDMYVSINNVQRVCSITGGAADTDEGEYLAKIIRNNLEQMVDADVQPVKHGRWIEQRHTPTNGYNYNIPYSTYVCSSCGLEIHNDEYSKYVRGVYTNCPVCTAKMDRGAENG